VTKLPEITADKGAEEASNEFVGFAKQSFGVDLDFSVESLRAVDEYLSKIHAAVKKQSSFLGRIVGKKLSEEDVWQIIGQAGFYTGEVVRRNLVTDHHWYAFSDWMRVFPQHEDFLGDEPGMGTAFILGNENSDMCLPLAKVGKFIQNGSEDSVYSFAKMFEAQEHKDEQD
jgi:hypothetical protein